jgi:hypothetical protein
MKLIALMPVRNEDWCLGLTARAALMWCDELIMLNHASTDGTTDIVLELRAEHSIRVHWIGVSPPTWNEMEHRQSLLEAARICKATHVAIIDADELLTGNLLCPIGAVRTIRGATNHQPLIRDYIESTPPGSILQLPGYNLRGSLGRYHANGIWGNRWFSTAFPDDPRLHWAGDNFHQREPLGMPLRDHKPVRQGEGGVLHLWGVNERRLRAKHRLYRVTERIRWPDKPVADIERMYSLYAQPQNGARRWEYAITPPEWLAPYAHLMQYLNVDAEPWQGAEADRLIAEHGTEYFKGLEVVR